MQKAIWPIIGLLVILLVGGAIYTYADSKNYKELQLAQDDFFKIRKDIEKTAETFAPPAPEIGKDGKPVVKKAAKAEATPAQKEQAFAPALEKMMAQIKANQGNQAAVEGALLVAEVTSEYKKYDMGVEALQTALKGFDSKNFLFGIAQGELGNLYAKLDKCSEATQAWEAVIAVKQHEYLANPLRLKAGICFEKLSMFDKAEKLYQTIVDKDPNSSSARTAKKFLLHIKFARAKAGEGTTQDPKKG